MIVFILMMRLCFEKKPDIGGVIGNFFGELIHNFTSSIPSYNDCGFPTNDSLDGAFEISIKAVHWDEVQGPSIVCLAHKAKLHVDDAVPLGLGSEEQEEIENSMLGSTNSKMKYLSRLWSQMSPS